MSAGRTWRNWSGSVRCAPRDVVRPRSVEEIAGIVRACRRRGRRIRPVGSGHSFTPLVATDDVMLSLDRFQGLVRVDPDARRAVVRAGTTLAALGPRLLAHGLAQENLGDVDRQTLAGALGTGTHGTGATVSNLPSQVEALTLVTGTGEVVECSAERDSDVLAAARVSLGALGVVAAVTLRLLPAYRLRFRTERRRLADVLGELDALVEGHRHFEFFTFPYSKFVQAKTQDPTDDPPTPGRLGGMAHDVGLENGAFWAVSEASRLIPALAPHVSRLAGWAVSSHRGVDHAHRVFTNRRWARFNEMEYGLPRERFGDALEEVRWTIDRERFRVNFPIECRFVAPDDAWLSPSYGRDSAYIALHVYRGMPYREYFAAVEPILRRHGGRPHWGKIHTLRSADLRTLYPRWDDFLAVRDRLDPEGVFLNAYLRDLFGVGR